MYWAISTVATWVQTHCEITEKVSRQPWSMAKVEIRTYPATETPVAYGFARCDDKDEFVREIGMRRAVTRARLELIYMLLEELFPFAAPMERNYRYSENWHIAVEKTFRDWTPPLPLMYALSKAMEETTDALVKGWAAEIKARG